MTIFILYGATGDLAKRMVLPAFYGLFAQDQLPEEWKLVGNGRGDMDLEEFRSQLREALGSAGVEVDEKLWQRFADNIVVAGSGFTEDDPGRLLDVLAELKESLDDHSLVHYLAVPPDAFQSFTKAIKAHGLNDNAKVVYEKPYGTSPEDFEELDKLVHTTFDEIDVFRIDHFLGKEATQNIHVARFTDRMIGNVWDRHNVAAVQIDIPETLNVIDRADFYDQTGALLDMIVTHLFQLAAEVAMEPPVTMKADDLADAREKVIDAFRPLAPDDVVYGQFEGYCDIDEVAPDSKTNTYVAARLWVDTDRWRGVPFLLRTGKMLAADAERITLIMRRSDVTLHHQPIVPGHITFDLQSSGALELGLTLKEPGVGSALTAYQARIDLAHSTSARPLEPYERLIYDVVAGEKTRFTRSDGLRYAWSAVEALLDNPPPLHTYQPRSWGPAAAEELAQPFGWLVGQ